MENLQLDRGFAHLKHRCCIWFILAGPKGINEVIEDELPHILDSRPTHRFSGGRFCLRLFLVLNEADHVVFNQPLAMILSERRTRRTLLDCSVGYVILEVRSGHDGGG